jgi:hypothetical protein
MTDAFDKCGNLIDITSDPTHAMNPIDRQWYDNEDLEPPPSHHRFKVHVLRGVRPDQGSCCAMSVAHAIAGLHTRFVFVDRRENFLTSRILASAYWGAPAAPVAPRSERPLTHRDIDCAGAASRPSIGRSGMRSSHDSAAGEGGGSGRDGDPRPTGSPAGKSTGLAGRCAYSGWTYLTAKILSPPSFGAPPTGAASY